jgi:hypothetical protein
MCSESDLQNGILGIRFSTMTMHLLALLCLCMIFWLKNNVTVIPHSPCLPHLTPCDIFIFPELNIVLKKMKFKDVTMIQVKSQAALAEFQTDDFRKCFELWHDHCACI